MVKANSPKGKRLHAAALARRRAAQSTVLPAADIAVLGAGASGLAAAIAAKRAAPEATVQLFEASDLLGKKLLATGNGRCNLSNADLAPWHYNDAPAVAAIMGPDPEAAVAAFFESLGLFLDAEDGRLYPLSHVAESVRVVLEAEALKLGVLPATMRAVTHIEPLSRGFELTYEERFREKPSGWATAVSRADAIIYACGAADLAPLERLGLAVKPFEPVLGPLAVAPRFSAEVDGRRAHVAISVLDQIDPEADEKNSRQELAAVGEHDVAGSRQAFTGELLLRERELSGIVAFDVSRAVHPGSTIAVDFAPDISFETLAHLIEQAEPDRERMHAVLSGILDPVLASEFLHLAEREHIASSEELAALIKACIFEVQGLSNPARAQVMRGGVELDQIDVGTMAALRQPGLYVTGEALDIDGACGGYNLAFAWLSGLKAGRAAAEQLHR